jgi:hypothetical protein
MAPHPGSDLKAAERLEQEVDKQGCGQANDGPNGRQRNSCESCVFFHPAAAKLFAGWPKARSLRSLRATANLRLSDGTEVESDSEANRRDHEQP